MGRVDDYRAELRDVPRREWARFLTERSGLPGPRGNIELAQAFADESDATVVDELLDTADEYLVFCGVVGLGRQLAENRGSEVEVRLRGYASDSRWRVREAVAMALQRLGDADIPRLERLVSEWVRDSDPLVERAAAAGICEPRLLAAPQAARTALEVCRVATQSLAALPSTRRREPEVRTLRQGLGYCWSVAVAADPARGLPVFAALSESPDQDVAWIVRENRKKNRLASLL